MNKLKIAVMLFALGITSVVAAQPQPSYNCHTGTYLEGGVGTNAFMIAIVTSGDNYATAGINGFGFNAAIGYNTTHWFALEAGYLQSFINVSNLENDKTYETVNAPYGAMRFTLPIRERFSFIGKVGLMYANTLIDNYNEDDSVSQSREGLVLPFIGVGAGYAVTPNLELNVQYQGAVYFIADAGILTGGLTYHF